MGLELDYLKNNGDCVIYNNTTGQFMSFYDWKGFKKAIKIMAPADSQVKDYFNFEDLKEFWTDRDFENIEEIEKYYGVEE